MNVANTIGPQSDNLIRLSKSFDILYDSLDLTKRFVLRVTAGEPEEYRITVRDNLSKITEHADTAREQIRRIMHEIVDHFKDLHKKNALFESLNRKLTERIKLENDTTKEAMAQLNEEKLLHDETRHELAATKKVNTELAKKENREKMLLKKIADLEEIQRKMEHAYAQSNDAWEQRYEKLRAENSDLILDNRRKTHYHKIAVNFYHKLNDEHEELKTKLEWYKYYFGDLVKQS